MTEAAVLRLIVSLIFVVALILACAWIARRAGWSRVTQGNAIRVLESRSLGARNYISLVEVDGTRLVLGVTQNQVSLLHTLPSTPDTEGAATSLPSPAHESTPSFAGSLKLILSKRRA